MLLMFAGFSLGMCVMSLLHDITRYRYARRFLRGLREPRALICALAVAAAIVGFSASDLTWSVAPLAAMAFVAVVIWVAGREEARRQAEPSATPRR